MNSTIATLMAFALGYAGMAGLSLAMDRHYEQLTRQRDIPRRRRRLFRSAGWLLLIAALMQCMRFWGAGIGIVAWLGVLTVCALLAAALLPYAPRLAAGLAAIAASLGLTGLGLERLFSISM